MYHLKMKEGIPLSARLDGFTDDEESTAVISYGAFEREYVEDAVTRFQGLGNKKLFVKNNIFVPHAGKNMVPVGAAVSRVELNVSDGYMQHTLIAGNNVREEQLSEGAVEDVAPLMQKLGDKKPVFLRPQIWSNCSLDVAMNKEQVGKLNTFFNERHSFVDAFYGDAVTNTEALLMNNATNGEFIGVETNLKGIMAFNNIREYCVATGQFYEDMCAIVQELVYISHEVLNCLIPKQIVLVIDSYRGIDIPRKDYIPNINDPLLHIPDYQNKINHVVALMKQLAAGRILCVNMPHFYVKLTITPALTIINFISALAETQRLVLHLPTVDNQILFQCEVEHNVYPDQILYNSNHNFITQRANTDAPEVLRALGNAYRDKLLNEEPPVCDSPMLPRNMNPRYRNINDVGFSAERAGIEGLSEMAEHLRLAKLQRPAINYSDWPDDIPF
jgi:hypothetical protein